MNLSAWLCRLLGHDWDLIQEYEGTRYVKQKCVNCGTERNLPEKLLKLPEDIPEEKIKEIQNVVRNA